MCCFFIIQPEAKATSKNKCQKYLNKVRSIQAQQRKGYTAQQGNKLRKKEAKARDKWWKCKNSPSKKVKKKAKKKSKNKLKKKNSK